MKYLALMLVLVPSLAASREVPVCYSGVCRMVEQDPLPSPTRDVPLEKSAKHRVADWKFWTVTAANVGVSVGTSYVIYDCRAKHDIETCVDGGYGEVSVRESLRNGLAVGLSTLSYFHKRAEDEDGSKHKFWWLFSFANIGVNAGAIIQNGFKNHGGPKKE